MATQQNAQIDMLLTQASSGYFPDGYVSEQIFPTVDVVQTTGLLGKYGSNHLSIQNTVVGGKGKYRRVETQVRSTTNYNVEGHGLEGLVTDKDYRNVLKPYDAEKDETLGITSILWLEKEKSVADALTDSAILTNYAALTGTDKWSDFGSSDPIDDITTGLNSVRDTSGAIANTIIMDYKVAMKLKYHPQLLDQLGYKYAKPGGLSYDEIAQALSVERILVPNVMYNSANSGQTAVLAPVWGKHCVIAALPKSADLRQVSLGYLVRLAGKSPRQVYKWSENNPPGSTAVLVEDSYDYLLSNVGAAYLLKDVIA